MKSNPIFVWSIAAFTHGVVSINSLSLVEQRSPRNIIANDSRLSAQSSPYHDEHDNSSTEDSWQKVSEITRLTTPWFSLLGERLRDHENNKLLDYWRVQRADSAVVLVLHRDSILLPKPMYRPGVQKKTLDFCGGRIDAGSNGQFLRDASAIVERELQVTTNDIESIQPLNSKPWPVNSSFSNQCLYGFVCKLKDEASVDNMRTFPNTQNGRRELLAELVCLQCRAVLLEYMFQHEG